MRDGSAWHETMQTRVADSLGLVRAQEVTFLKMRNSYILLLQFLPQRSVESTLNSDLEKKWNDEKRGVKTCRLRAHVPCRVHEEMSRRHARIQGTWCIQAIDRVSGFSHTCGVALRRLSLEGSIELDERSDVFPHAAVIIVY